MRLTENKPIPGFSQLLLEKSLLSTEEMKLYIGGGDHTLQEILNIFTYSIAGANLDPNQVLVAGQDLTPQQRADFEDVVERLNYTDVGHALLNYLVDSGKKINISFDLNTGDNEYYSPKFNDDKNMIVLGNPTNTNEGKQFAFIAHELWHAYVDLAAFRVGSTSPSTVLPPGEQLYSGTSNMTTVREEMDAELFASMAVAQYDIWYCEYWEWNPPPTFYSYINQLKDLTQWSPQRVPNSPSQTEAANNLYNAGFDQLVMNRDFSVDAYNQMLANFELGSVYGAWGGPTLDQSEPIGLASLNPNSGTDKPLQLLLSAYFTEDLNPAGSGTSGSSSSGSYNYGVSFAYFMNSMYMANGGSWFNDYEITIDGLYFDGNNYYSAPSGWTVSFTISVNNMGNYMAMYNYMNTNAGYGGGSGWAWNGWGGYTWGYGY